MLHTNFSSCWWNVNDEARLQIFFPRTEKPRHGTCGKIGKPSYICLSQLSLGFKPGFEDRELNLVEEDIVQCTMERSKELSGRKPSWNIQYPLCCSMYITYSSYCSSSPVVCGVSGSAAGGVDVRKKCMHTKKISTHLCRSFSVML